LTKLILVDKLILAYACEPVCIRMHTRTSRRERRRKCIYLHAYNTCIHAKVTSIGTGGGKLGPQNKQIQLVFLPSPDELTNSVFSLEQEVEDQVTVSKEHQPFRDLREAGIGHELPLREVRERERARATENDQPRSP
jgi:hypothetical protein